MNPSKYQLNDVIVTTFCYLGNTQERTSKICPRASYVGDNGENQFVLEEVGTGCQIRATEQEIDRVFVRFVSRAVV